MKYGYTTLTRVITDPKEALDEMLNAYFHSDTCKHGIDVITHSLRSDMVDGEDIAANIDSSLNYILSCYFDVYTVSAEKVGVSGKNVNIELSITVTDDGRVIPIESVLDIANGKLSGIRQIGHL